MQVHLFIPCLVEDFYPDIGEAAARLLAKAGADLAYPAGQTCCGQPEYKLGRYENARPLAKRWIKLFHKAHAVVAPSGSCVRMVRDYPKLFADEPAWREKAEALAAKTFELTQFLVDMLGFTDPDAELPARVAFHDSCQVGRGLGVREQPRALLSKVRGLELVELARPDACCGFGGSFSLEFPEVSAAILENKIHDVLATGARFVATAEPSCMMHMDGYLRAHRMSCRAVHVAQVLAGMVPMEAGRD